MKIKTEQTSRASGRARHRICTRGCEPPPWSPWQKNLVLGVWSSCWYRTQLACQVGTGTTPNSVTLDGTFQQTGTTVTRASGTGEFTAANVNDFIRFATGERASIISFTNSVTVEVDRSQEVGAAALDLFDTSRTALDANVKGAATTPGNGNRDADNARITYSQTYSFSIETSAQTYTEIGLFGDALFSRLVFDSPVNVDIDQFLEIDYEWVLDMADFLTVPEFEGEVTGWPRPYDIVSITSDGTDWTVTLAEAHTGHYEVGGTINIVDALPPKTDIVSITSTATEFTVEATAHGKTVGMEIEIEDATPNDYNGTWTVDTVTDADHLTVSSAINPGAGSGGTVREVTPSTWFDGEHVISALPTATTIEIANAATPIDAGPEGLVRNNLKAKVYPRGYLVAVPPNGFSDSTTNRKSGPSDPVAGTVEGIIDTLYGLSGSGAIFTPDYGDSPSVNDPLTGATMTHTSDYHVPTRTKSYDIAIRLPSSFESPNLRVLRFAWNVSSGASSTNRNNIEIHFDEPQRIDDGYILDVDIEMSFKWEPDLG